MSLGGVEVRFRLFELAVLLGEQAEVEFQLSGHLGDVGPALMNHTAGGSGSAEQAAQGERLS